MKKGFTVIELLATIIILGIIGTIGVVVFDNVIHNMRIKAFETQKESIILSAQKWISDKRGTENYPNTFPYQLTLEELLKEEYIEKNICNQEERLTIDYKNSYIEIKENNKTYEYNLVINNTGVECKWYILQLKMNISKK